MKQLVQSLREENQALRTELAYYKSGRNSKNSHLPPGQDIHKKPIAAHRKKKSSRNPGGQHGHKASRLEQIENPDEVIVHDVSTCLHCGEDISQESAEMIRKGQIFDIPRIELRVTEHHQIAKCCPKCGKQSKSALRIVKMRQYQSYYKLDTDSMFRKSVHQSM